MWKALKIAVDKTQLFAGLRMLSVVVRVFP